MAGYVIRLSGLNSYSLSVKDTVISQIRRVDYGERAKRDVTEHNERDLTCIAKRLGNLVL